MAPNIKGTRTEKNLAIAYAGECMARNRYTYFASKAKKQGYEQISAIFLETSENEKEHAKRFLKFLKGDGSNINVQMAIPTFSIGTTLENLRTAAKGENEEHTHMYPHMAAIAEQEDFPEIAECFRRISEVEREHEIRFNILADQLESGTLWKRNRVVKWKCRNCGYVSEGMEAPMVCPACAHEQNFQEMKEIIE